MRLTQTDKTHSGCKMKNLKLVLHPCSSVSIRGNKDAFMKKLFIISVALLLALTLCGVSSAQEAQPLTSFDFTLVGVGLNTSPKYPAVPRASPAVLTNFFARGSRCRRRSSTGSPRTSGEGRPDRAGHNRPGAFDQGRQALQPAVVLPRQVHPRHHPAVRRRGQVPVQRLAQAVTIESIGDPLITSVTTRQLTRQEIRNRGVGRLHQLHGLQLAAVLGTSSSRGPVGFQI